MTIKTKIDAIHEMSIRLNEEFDRLMKLHKFTNWMDMAAYFGLDHRIVWNWIIDNRSKTSVPCAYYLANLSDHGVDIVYVLTGRRKE